MSTVGCRPPIVSNVVCKQCVLCFSVASTGLDHAVLVNKSLCFSVAGILLETHATSPDSVSEGRFVRFRRRNQILTLLFFPLLFSMPVVLLTLLLSLLLLPLLLFLPLLLLLLLPLPMLLFLLLSPACGFHLKCRFTILAETKKKKVKFDQNGSPWQISEFMMRHWLRSSSPDTTSLPPHQRVHSSTGEDNTSQKVF